MILNYNLSVLIKQGKFHSFHPVATILSYLTKAPLVSVTLIFMTNWLLKIYNFAYVYKFYSIYHHPNEIRKWIKVIDADM